VPSVGKRFLLAFFLIPISLYTVFWLTLRIVAGLDEMWLPAWIGNQAGAEVVAILPETAPDTYSASVVPLWEMQRFVAEHPNCTFSIPRGHENGLVDQLKRKPKFTVLNFKVQQLADSKQEVTLEDMDPTDDTHGTQYEVVGDQVRLKYYRLIGDRDFMGCMLVAGALTIAIHLIAGGYLAYRLIWRRSSS